MLISSSIHLYYVYVNRIVSSGILKCETATGMLIAEGKLQAGENPNDDNSNNNNN